MNVQIVFQPWHSLWVHAYELIAHSWQQAYTYFHLFILYCKLLECQKIEKKILHCNSHWTTTSIFWLSCPQELRAVQVYCPAISLLMSYNDHILPFSISTFDSLNQEILGAGRPKPLQPRVTFWPSLATMPLHTAVADAETTKKNNIFP